MRPTMRSPSSTIFNNTVFSVIIVGLPAGCGGDQGASHSSIPNRRCCHARTVSDKATRGNDGGDEANVLSLQPDNVFGGTMNLPVFLLIKDEPANVVEQLANTSHACDVCRRQEREDPAQHPFSQRVKCHFCCLAPAAVSAWICHYFAHTNVLCNSDVCELVMILLEY